MLKYSHRIHVAFAALVCVLTESRAFQVCVLSSAVTEDRAVDAAVAVADEVGLATTFCGSVGDLSPRAQHAARNENRVSNS